VAACSIVYELLLAQTLSALLGDTVRRYSITIGCFLGALGVGTMVCDDAPAHAAERLVKVELALSILGGLAVPLLWALDVLQRHSPLLAATAAFAVSAHLLILAIGFLSGLEIPLLLALAEERRPDSTNTILGVNYAGALVGAVLFPLVLVRQIGVLAGGFVVAMWNALACGLLLTLAPAPAGRRLVAAPIAVLLVLGVGFVAAAPLERVFVQASFHTGQALGGSEGAGERPHGDIRPAVRPAAAAEPAAAARRRST
jgi:spermidine synthase